MELSARSCDWQIISRLINEKKEESLTLWHANCNIFGMNARSKKICWFEYSLLISVFASLPALSWADTHLAASCSLADVSKAITGSSPRDTVLVPAGSATWTSTLRITKGIYLIGAGVGKTIITGGTDALISYNPSDYIANDPFRLSGFELDANGDCCLLLGEYSKRAPFPLQTKVRIDHNRFKNTSSKQIKGQAIRNYGTLYGVVDNNVFDGMGYPIGHNAGEVDDSYGWWQNSPQSIFLPGSEYYLYFEDNEFNLVQYDSDGNILTDCEYAARLAFRYNTITTPCSTQQIFETHGQQGTGMPATFGYEIYGNNIISGNKSFNLIRARAGIGLVFYNNAETTTLPGISVYHDDETTCSSIEPARKIIHDTYWWNSRKNYGGSLFDMGVEEDFPGLNCAGLTNIPQMGRDLFSDTSTPGITMGLLANRPKTCTKGQAYWATDQSTTDLTGMVGRNPTTPILGTLYKAVATNTWEAFYTPYAYPHPLRAEPDSGSAILAPTNLRIVK
jgi:hypothetical protein